MNAHGPPPSITLVVATYNRADLLAGLLDSVAEQRVPHGLQWELLVVDNNSRDATGSVVQRYDDVIPINYVFEQRQGKTFALNRALEEAEGSVFLFTDDDVVLEAGWLSAYAAAIARHTEAAWFGGAVLPLWPAGRRPDWFQGNAVPLLGGYFGHFRPAGDGSRYFDDSDELLPIGASMAVRRSTFEKVGNYRVDLGPRGSQRGVGDDTELLQRAMQRGEKGYYVAEAKCWHRVHESRMKLRAFVDYGMRKAEDQCRYIERLKNGGSFLRIVDQLGRGAYQGLSGRAGNLRICLFNVGYEIGRMRMHALRRA